MENKFFIDSEHLSEAALNKKHLLKPTHHQEQIIWNI